MARKPLVVSAVARIFRVQANETVIVEELAYSHLTAEQRAYFEGLKERDRLDSIRAKAEAYALANPQPRAMFLID